MSAIDDVEKYEKPIPGHGYVVDAEIAYDLAVELEDTKDRLRIKEEVIKELKRMLDER